jgi:hypothetical protein
MWKMSCIWTFGKGMSSSQQMEGLGLKGASRVKEYPSSPQNMAPLKALPENSTKGKVSIGITFKGKCAELGDPIGELR